MRKIIFGLLLGILAAAGGLAQEHTENKSDQVLRGSGRVNPSTLGMEISIPLASYPGRGINVPISLNYSSKVWRMDYQYDTEGGIVTGGCRSVHAARFGENSASGWTTSLAVPYVEYVGRDNLFNERGFPYGTETCVNAPPNHYQPAYIRRLIVHLPGGESHELRSDDSPEIFQFGQGNDPFHQSSWNRTFYAVDGSNLRYIENSTNGTYRLQMPDGSFYDFATSHGAGVDGATIRKATKFTDRNGNFTSYDLGTGIWTDTLGREIAPPIGSTAPAEATTINYSLPGLNGTYKLTWKRLKGISAAESALTDFNQDLKYLGPHMHPTSNGNWALRPAGTYLFNSEFEHYALSGTELFNPVVLTEIELPTGQSYRFSYDIYGLIEKIEYPSGGEEQFGYQPVSPLTKQEPNTLGWQTNFGVVNRKLYPVANGPFYEWVYSASYVDTTGYKVSTLNPDGTLSERFLYQGNQPCIGEGCDTGSFGFDNILAGMQYESRAYDSATPRRLVSQSITTWTSTPFPAVALGVPTWHPRVVKEEARIFDNTGNGNSATTTIDYEGDLNLRDTPVLANRTSKFAFVTVGSPQPQIPIKVSEATYLINDPNYVGTKSAYIAKNLMGLVTATQVKDANGQVVGKSEFIHDEAAYFDNSYTATGWVDPQSGLRGNVTTTRTWHAEASSWIKTHTMFDNFGNVRKVWDTSGDATRFVETEYDPQYKYAYPTKTKAPAPDPTGVSGTTEGSEITRTYDFNTGLLLSVTDARGQTAYNEYNDPYNRLTKTIPPAGGSISEIIYNDTPGNVWVKSRQQIDENNWAESTVFFDNLGRAIRGRTKDLQGDIVSEVRFDSVGRVEKTSNPYRVDAQGNPAETVYWSKLRYDHANRVVETYAPAPDGQTGISLGTVEFGISDLPGLIGTYTVAIDASGRKSRAISGIYGLMRIDEAVSKGGSIDQDLGTLANPAQPTHYSYNSKGELVKVTQGQQHRFFMYDSLGRLIRVRQPEQIPNANLATTGNPENNQWTAAYSYDVFGNVISMTDAKDTTITNHYDKAGRTTKRTYTDGTPQVEFFYDGKGLPSIPQFAKGALTKVTSSVSEDRFTSFDNHGRLLASEQRTDGTTYGFSYKYNLSGGLIEQTYPSGRVVRNFLDSDGGLNSVMTKPNGGWNTRVISDFDYSASGSIRKVKLGNGLWETADIDHLGQLRQVGLGTGPANNDVFKIDYEYGELQTNGTVDAAKNTGNIAKATTTIPTASFVQTFKYDAINRLTEAKETTGEATNWLQTFGYDRYGNRTSFSETIAGIVTQNSNINHPTIDPATNRFTTGQGYVYDLNGNIVQDAAGRSFTFNGDDRQTEVQNTATNAIIGEYSYDPSGARVKKHVPSTGETTIFVYDAGGALAAEYSTVVETASPTTSYLTTDHLGSPRVVTDADGEVIARRDFMPFGEDLGAGIGPRTENLKYSVFATDRVRQRFTGYEKDGETGLDFAEARMYQNKHGRFTAPDPLLASASAANPQTFNRYIYTGNNPVNITDPSGLKWCGIGGNGNGVDGVQWFKNGVCSGDWKDLDLNAAYTCNIGPCTISGTTYAQGTVFRFSADGQYRAALADPGPRATPQGQATAQGQSVQQGSTVVSGTTAADAAASGSGSQGVSGTGLLSLCPTGEICPIPSGPPIIVDLTPGASAEEVLLTTQTLLTFVGMTEIPIISQAAEITNIGLDAIQGDWVAVGIGAGTLVPIGGALASVALNAHRARKLSNAVDAVRKNPSSAITDSTSKKSRFPNTDTDASPLSVARTLKQNGFGSSRSTDRKALVFQKGEKKYSLRMNSKSTDGPTLDYSKGDSTIRKIRLNR